MTFRTPLRLMPTLVLVVATQLTGSIVRADAPAPASARSKHDSKHDRWIELIHPGPLVRAKLVKGDLLARIGRGGTAGKGQIHLEGDQALVFFLGGTKSGQSIREIRGRTPDGRTFLLKGVRLERLETAGAVTRAHLVYRDLVVP